MYADHTLLTANKKITLGLVTIFDALQKNTVPQGIKNLLVSPVDSRPLLYKMIDREISNAKKSIPAYIILKMNSLADEGMIGYLYKASNAGVKIKLVIRGMCCLVPGVKGYSENIEVISIVDKYLEHARIYIFADGGKEQIFLTSSDLMTRNLDHRVEVGFPVLEKNLKQEIKDIINIQLHDNTKAREINSLNNNRYLKTDDKTKIRSQFDTYTYLKQKK